MPRILFPFIFAFVAMAGFGISPIPALLGSAHAQPQNSGKKNPYLRYSTKYQKRVKELLTSCDIGKMQSLLIEMRASEVNLSDEVQVLDALIEVSGEDADKEKKKLAVAALDQFYLLRESMRNSCEPGRIKSNIYNSINDCDFKKADRLLARLRLIVNLYRNRYQVAQALGKASKIDAKNAGRVYDGMQKGYDQTATDLQKAKSKKQPGKGSCDNGQILTLSDIGGPPTEFAANSPAVAQALERTNRAEKKSAWLLGDWKYKAWNGGTSNSVLRFKFESDDTISGYLISTTNEMAKKGYQPGMKLLQGINDTSRLINPRGSIWSHRANVAKIYSPRDPKRKPGQIYGQPQWLKGGILFLEKKTGELGGSTGFQNRLNWHRGKLLRPDLTPLEDVIRQMTARVNQLDAQGDRNSQMAATEDIIAQLHATGLNSQEARDAANILGYLRNREAFRNNGDLQNAYKILESSRSSSKRKTALETLASYITAQSAHLAQPVAGNDYTDKTAAQMFLIGRYGSALLDDIRNPSGAYAKTNMSRLTAGLATLQGIASLAENPKGKTGRALMEGLRNLTTIPAAKAGLTGILDMPAEVAIALTQQSVKGLGHASSALKEFPKALGGDRAAMERIMDQARQLDKTVSARGYGEAIKSAITDRLINRIPFARTMVNWFR